MPGVADSPSVQIQVGGKTYTATLRELTGRDARDFRLVTGFSLLTAMARRDLDIDVGAGIVWLIRRRDEPRLSYEDLLDQINYENYFASDQPTTNGQAPPEGEVDPET